MVAFNASRLVCAAMELMSLTTAPMRPAAAVSYDIRTSVR
jgi:hypothetical protein